MLFRFFYILLARYFYRLFLLKKCIIYTVFVILGLQVLSAQELLIQWTGTVRSDLLQPLPFAHVIVQRDFRGTVSDPNGVFTIITYPRDTLIVSSLGYKTLMIPVPNFTNDDSRHYFKDIILEEDAIELRELIIFPWRTYREFREAFVALDLPEDDLQRAYRNISAIQDQLHSAIYNRQQSPNASFRDFMNSRTNRMMSYGHMYPMYTITNPIAWAQFFQALQRGEFRRRENDNDRAPSVIDEVLQEQINR